jgi:hypothetical protein
VCGPFGGDRARVWCDVMIRLCLHSGLSSAFIAEVCHTDQASSPRFMDAFDPSAEMSVLLSTAIAMGISLST